MSGRGPQPRTRFVRVPCVDSGTTVIRISGSLGPRAKPHLTRLTQECLRRNLPRLVFDLSEVDALGGGTARLLNEFAAERAGRGGRTAFRVTSRTVRGFLCADPNLPPPPLCASVDEAVEAVRDGRSPRIAEPRAARPAPAESRAPEPSRSATGLAPGREVPEPGPLQSPADSQSLPAAWPSRRDSVPEPSLAALLLPESLLLPEDDTEDEPLRIASPETTDPFAAELEDPDGVVIGDDIFDLDLSAAIDDRPAPEWGKPARAGTPEALRDRLVTSLHERGVASRLFLFQRADDGRYCLVTRQGPDRERSFDAAGGLGCQRDRALRSRILGGSGCRGAVARGGRAARGTQLRGRRPPRSRRVAGVRGLRLQGDAGGRVQSRGAAGAGGNPAHRRTEPGPARQRAREAAGARATAGGGRPGSGAGSRGRCTGAGTCAGIRAGGSAAARGRAADGPGRAGRAGRTAAGCRRPGARQRVRGRRARASGAHPRRRSARCRRGPAGLLAEATRALRRTVAQMRDILSLSQDFDAAFGTSKLLEVLVLSVVSVARVETVFYFSGRDTDYRLTHQRGMSPDAVQSLRLRADSSLVQRALASSRGLCIADDARITEEERIWARQHGLRWAVPFRFKDETLGLLLLGESAGEAPPDLDMLALLLDQAGLAYDRARLYEMLQDRTLGVVRGLITLIEARNGFDCGSTEQVVRYTQALARELQFPAESLRDLVYGAVLRDVGMLKVSESLLRSPADLSGDQWESIRRHPQEGAAIMRQMRFSPLAVDVVLHHHEAYNGEGYPLGLRGRTIPLGARIIAVAESVRENDHGPPVSQSTRQGRGAGEPGGELGPALRPAGGGRAGPGGQSRASIGLKGDRDLARDLFGV